MEPVQSRVSSVVKCLHVKTLIQPANKKRELEIQGLVQGNPAHTTILTAFHRRKQSYTPTIATDIIGRPETVFRSAVRRYLSSFFIVSATIPEKKTNNRNLVSLQL